MKIYYLWCGEICHKKNYPRATDQAESDDGGLYVYRSCCYFSEIIFRPTSFSNVTWNRSWSRDSILSSSPYSLIRTFSPHGTNCSLSTSAILVENNFVVSLMVWSFLNSRKSANFSIPWGLETVSQPSKACKNSMFCHTSSPSESLAPRTSIHLEFLSVLCRYILWILSLE